MDKNTSKRERSNLEITRRLAEKKAEAMNFENAETLSPAAVQQILHDLRVHQIELEMQNEELRLAQEALEISRERYFDLYDLAPVGYFTLNEKGIILEANLTASALLEIPRGKLSQQPMSCFIHQDSQDAFYLLQRTLYHTGESQQGEVRIVRPGGDPVWAQLEANLARNNKTGRMDCRLTVSDIHARKIAEEALAQTLLEKSILFDELQHRVKNSFFLIDSLVSLEESQALSQPVRAVLDTLHQRIQTLGKLYAMLYSEGGLAIHLDEYLGAISRTLMDTYRNGGGDVDLRLSLEPMTASAKSASAFGLILNELFTNALKHSLPGLRHGLIHVILKRDDTRVLLEVECNGAKPPVGFTLAGSQGLGLKLVHLLAHQLDGEAHFESADTVRFGVRVSTDSLRG